MRKITLGKYSVYGQMEEIANGETDIEEYVFKGGNVIPANQDTGKAEPVFDIIPEGVFAG